MKERSQTLQLGDPPLQKNEQALIPGLWALPPLPPSLMSNGAEGDETRGSKVCEFPALASSILKSHPHGNLTISYNFLHNFFVS